MFFILVIMLELKLQHTGLY